jgi:hypothetical protein
MDNHAQERLFTEKEAAQMLRLKDRTALWQLRRRGGIGHYVIGRRIYYGATHLAEFLKRCERRPKQEAVAA